MGSDAQNDRIPPNVLVAIDGSPSSDQALKYLLSIRKLIPDLRITVVQVLPNTPQFLSQEAKIDYNLKVRLKKLAQANRRQAELNLEKARQFLEKSGLPRDWIETRVRPSTSGLVKDLISEAEMGLFDALVLGRRGLTKTQELFMGSVSNQIISYAVNVPIWITDGRIMEPKIMVAVDGSEASLRAVDHVAFILGGNPEASIEFLHVAPKLQSYCAIDLEGAETAWPDAAEELSAIEIEFRRDDQVCQDDFFQKAISILAKAGFSPDRLNFEQREITLGVARTIIQAARDKKCGTVVIGRRGLGRSSFLGSVSYRVMRRAENLAVWMVN